MRLRTSIFAAVTLLLGSLPLSAQDPADAAWAAGDHDRARVLYAERLAADSTDISALHRLGLMLAWNGEYDRALPLLDRLMAFAPSRAARLDRANVRAWSGDRARALADVDTLLAADSSALDAWTARARFLSWARRFDESLAAYDRLDKLAPGDTAVGHARARVLGWAGRYDAAEAIYLELLAADPADAEALRGLARVTSWRGDLSGGEELWRRAVAADPGHAESHMGLSQLLRWRGQSRAALEQAEAAARLDPQNRDVQLELAWARVAFAPRITPSASAEFDSDENRLLTTSLTVSGWVQRRVALTAHGYLRRADDARPDALASRALTLGARTEVAGGWNVGVSAGVQDADVAGRDPVFLAGATLALPARLPVSATLAYTRSAFDATALLIERGITIEDLALSAGTQLRPRVRLEGAAARTHFKGVERDNDRLLGRIGLDVRANGWLRARPRALAFRFRRDLDEGYFDPDRYLLGEVGLGAERYGATWSFSAEAAPGAQQVGSGADFKPTINSRLRVGYQLAPGRELSLSLAFSNLGIERVQAGDASYRYGAIVLSGGWSF